MAVKTLRLTFLECVGLLVTQSIWFTYDGCHTHRAQGMYAGEVGVPRLLKLFKKYNITTTWFIPGTS